MRFLTLHGNAISPQSAEIIVIPFDKITYINSQVDSEDKPNSCYVNGVLVVESFNAIMQMLTKEQDD